MRVWLLASFLLAIISFVFLIAFPSAAFTGSRFNGMLSNPNQYGVTAAIMLVPTVWHILEKKTYRIIVLSLAFWWFFSIVMSGSRAGMITLLPVAIHIALNHTNRPVVWVAATISAFAFLIATQFWLDPATLDRFFSSQGSGRYERWAFAWSQVEAKPLFGHGFGWADEEIQINVHNSYILLLIGIGFLGTLPLALGFLFIQSRTLFAKISVYNPTLIFRMRTAKLLAALALGLMINAFFENWMVGVGNSTLIAFFIIMNLHAGMYEKLSAGGRQERLFC